MTHAPKQPIFLSIVVPIDEIANHIEGILKKVVDVTSSLVADYEVIVIDNASNDGTLERLKNLTSVSGLPNLVVFELTSKVRKEISAWVGIEASLGDYIMVFDPTTDDVGMIKEMLNLNVNDVVLAYNTRNRSSGILYNFCHSFFKKIYLMLEGVELGRDDSHFRLMSRKVVNFMLQHSRPEVSYRYLPSSYGFQRKVVEYAHDPLIVTRKRLLDGIDKGMSLLVSNNRLPMRLVTILSLFGAASNALYSIYVILVALFKENVQPGWVTLSLQQSGMFFLISLVLLVMGEYLLTIVSANNNPRYHVAQEFTSAIMTRYKKLNIEDNTHV